MVFKWNMNIFHDIISVWKWSLEMFIMVRYLYTEKEITLIYQCPYLDQIISHDFPCRLVDLAVRGGLCDHQLGSLHCARALQWQNSVWLGWLVGGLAEWFNPINLGDVAVFIKAQFSSNSFHKTIPLALAVKFLSSECHRISLMLHQHRFR